MNEQPENYNAKSFEELLDRTLEPNSDLYVSPWIGKEHAESVIEHKNTDTVYMALTEDHDIIYENDKPKKGPNDSRFIENYTREHDNISTVSSMKEVAESGELSLDGEFLAPPGTYATRQMSENNARQLITSWTSISNDVIEDGFRFYSDAVWTDPRIDPQPENMNLEDLHEEVEIGMLPDLETHVIEGRDYSGVLGIK